MVREDPGGGSQALIELINEHGAALYSDFMDRGINLAREIPLMGTPGSGYTPRLLLVLVENLGEGTNFMASVTGVPEMRYWTTTHDVLAAIHNTELNAILIQLEKDKRKGFEYMKSPLQIHREKQKKKQGQKRGRSALLDGVTFSADIPLELLGLPPRK